jgi:acyl dehydratase
MIAANEGGVTMTDVAAPALAPQTYAITRADLVRYAGASGDFNPIHWSDRVASGVGLPGVIAHGMLTMALAGRALVTWVGGDSGAITDYSVRFARPVVVPDDDLGTELTVTGTVKPAGDNGIVQIDISAVCNGEKVLAQAKAWVRASALDAAA